MPDFYDEKKRPRYYQRIAIERAVRAIVGGQKRCLLTLATGTGKTTVAFQICWKLWSAKWNAKGDATRKPRILFLADRNMLVDDPKDKDFAPFGDARLQDQGEGGQEAGDVLRHLPVHRRGRERGRGSTSSTRPTSSTSS